MNQFVFLRFDDERIIDCVHWNGEGVFGRRSLRAFSDEYDITLVGFPEMKPIFHMAFAKLDAFATFRTIYPSIQEITPQSGKYMIWSDVEYVHFRLMWNTLSD